MKNLSKKIISDINGFAVTGLLLILIPLSFILIITLNETARVSRVADKTINYAVVNAVKSSALMVDPESQAQGNPHIAHERAYSKFIETLLYDMTLDSSGKGELASSISSTDGLKFWLLIYNGDEDYAGYTESYRVASYAYYTNESGSVERVVSDSITGFPKTLYVGDNGITETSEGNTKVELNTPGVLAVIQAKVKPITTDKEELVTRWAYGRIVKN